MLVTYRCVVPHLKAGYKQGAQDEVDALALLQFGAFNRSKGVSKTLLHDETSTTTWEILTEEGTDISNFVQAIADKYGATVTVLPSNSYPIHQASPRITSFEAERRLTKTPMDITIRTRVPSKWRFVDTETNETWKWQCGKFVLA